MGIFLSSAFSVHLCSSAFRKFRGAIHRVTPLASHPCIRSISSRIGTMMQSYASAVRLRGDGPILVLGMEAMVCIGLPPPRIFMVGSEAIRTRPMNFEVQDSRSGCGFQNDAFGHFAKSDKLPQGNQQLAGQCDDHRLADIGPPIKCALSVPVGQFAIFLVPKKPPGELDHAVSNARVASSRQPLS